MKRLIITILAMTVLLVGCAPNGGEVDKLKQENTRLQSRVTQLEEQLAKEGTERDKGKAIVKFAEQALQLQGIFMDVRNKWLVYLDQNLPEKFPSYTTRNKELEMISKVETLSTEAGSAIGSIEQLYAPQEAMEIKTKLLAEGDSLLKAFGEIINFYRGPGLPSSVFLDAYQLIYYDLEETNRNIRRELTDLRLEYGQ